MAFLTGLFGAAKFLFLSCILLMSNSGIGYSEALSANTTVIAGFHFGELKTLIQAQSYVYHIEVDLSDPNMLLFSDGHALKFTDGKISTTLVGSATVEGYVDGTGTSARFDGITGFAQVNKMTMVLADHHNHCLREVDRVSLKTSVFAGKCWVPSIIDGEKSLFSPYSVLTNKYNTGSTSLLVTDYYGHAVRLVDILTRRITTLIAEAAGCRFPSSMTFDISGKNLIISNNYYLSKYSMQTGVLTNITGTTESGFADGTLSQARFKQPREIISLSDDTAVVADEINNRLRVVNSAQNSVSSVCTGFHDSSGGSAKKCTLGYPHALLLHEGAIYIGEHEAVRILEFPGIDNKKATICSEPRLSCPKDVHAVLEENHTEAVANWTTPYDVPVSMHLPAGNYSFSYKLSDDTYCIFHVTVKNSYTPDKDPINITPPERDQPTCRDDISVLMDGSQSETLVNLTTPCGEIISAYLPAGEHTFSYPLKNGYRCTYSVSVKQAGDSGSEEKCDELPSTSVTEVDSVTGTGQMTLRCSVKEWYQLELPVGTYNYLYHSYNKTGSTSSCLKSIRVVDTEVKNRLDFVAKYKVKCDQLDSTIEYSVLKSMAEQMYTEIEDICHGGCARDSHAEVKITCELDILSISWPTNVTFPGSVKTIPNEFSEEIEPRLKMKHLLKITLYSFIPPIIYPELDGDSLTAQPVLSPVCPDGYELDSLADTCLSKGV